MKYSGAKKIFSIWEQFWFEADGRGQMKLFRQVFGWVLFLYYLTRTPDLEFFYSDSGIVQKAFLPDLMPQHYQYSIFYYFSNLKLLWGAHFVFLASLMSFALGFYPKVAAALSLFLHCSFVHRNLAPAYGVDSITTYYLFYMCFAQTTGSFREKNSILSSMAYRFGQVQLCVIYAYSGLGKLAGAQWWHGDAIWYVLGNRQISSGDFSWAAHFPTLLVIGAYLTVLWEAYFPALIWVKPIQKAVLAFGVLLHLGIALTIHLPFFGAVMFCCYIFFLSHSDIDRISQLLKDFRLKLKSA